LFGQVQGRKIVDGYDYPNRVYDWVEEMPDENTAYFVTISCRMTR